jgi:SAM-dependent methyltransferase
MSLVSVISYADNKKHRIARFAAQHWPTASLVENRVWKSEHYGINEHAKQRHYSFRLLRYWYVERLLATEATRLGRPLNVLEIGVDRGQMKAFVDGATREHAPYVRWDAADIHPQNELLTASGYAHCLTLDLDDPESLADFVKEHAHQYDAIVLLHVLEHISKPERAVTFLSATLRANGVVIGGFPVLPSGVARLREWQLQRSAAPFGHISAFSPRRVRKMAERAGLTTDYMSGAFGIRASGSPMENQAWWFRLNISFGALFPGWPGEIYWQLRKTVNARARTLHGHPLAPPNIAGLG